MLSTSKYGKINVGWNADFLITFDGDKLLAYFYFFFANESKFSWLLGDKRILVLLTEIGPKSGWTSNGAEKDQIW